MTPYYIPISEIGKVITGKTPSTADAANFGDDYPFITPTDINTFFERYLTATERGISNYGAMRLKNYLLPPNTVCFVCIGSTIGKMCLTGKPSFTNQQINALIVKDAFHPHYIFYLLRYTKGYFQQLGAGTGSGKGIVNKTTFENTKIPVITDKMMQTRIAETLSRYDDFIEKNNHKIEILQQQAQELYKEWFVRNRSNRWRLIKLRQFGYSLESGSRPKGGVDTALTDGYPSLGAESIDRLGRFDYSNVKFVSEAFYKKMKRGHGKDGDILLYKDGAYIGKVTLYMDQYPFREYAVNEHVFLIRSKNPIYQFYIYFTLNLPQYFALMQNLNRNAAQPGLTRKDIDTIKLYMPDEKTVNQFNDMVAPILHNIFLLARNNELLKKQRDLLLPRLMSGKLKIQS